MSSTSVILRDEAEALFKTLDQAGRGWLSLTEASIIVTTLGLELSPEEIVEKLPALPHPLDKSFQPDMDMVMNGRVGCEEFIVLLGATSHVSHEGVFDILDQDKDGKITVHDLRGFMGDEVRTLDRLHETNVRNN